MIICDFEKITIEEQEKFLEILKASQVSTVPLPENLKVIMLAKTNCELNQKIARLVEYIPEPPVTTFKHLIDKHPWQDVKETLLSIYNKEIVNIDNYKKVFKKLKELESQETNVILYIEPFELDPDEIEEYPEDERTKHPHVFGKTLIPPDEKEDVIPEFVRVMGREPTEDEEGFELEFLERLRCPKYALEYTPWGEWLNFIISEETLSRYSELEIIAYCLFEMTWSGYDEEIIQGQLAMFAERYEEMVKDVENKRNN